MKSQRETERGGGRGEQNKKQMYIYTDYQSRLLKNRLKIFEDSICHKNVCLNILYYVIYIQKATIQNKIQKNVL